MFKPKIFVFCMIFLFLISFGMTAPPQETSTGLLIRAGINNYIPANTYYDVHTHVIDVDTGLPVTSGICCYFHLYNHNGTHLLEREDCTSSHTFDYGFDIYAENITDVGHHLYNIQCNGTHDATDKGGLVSGEVTVNKYGEELTDSITKAHNTSMWFLMILFLTFFAGIIFIPNPVLKWGSYFATHVIFIIGTFSEWQFLDGYATTVMANIGIYKILFYVSITLLFPMVLVAIAWMVYYHTFNEHMQKMMEKGEDPETAFKMANKKTGGWF